MAHISMLTLLVRTFRGRRLRTWLTTAGVAVCTLLVIVIASAFRSVRTAMSDYVGQPTIDFWVAPRSADNLIRGSFISFVPLSAVEEIRRIPGVAAADPILEAFLPVQPVGSKDPMKRLTLLTIGFRQPNGLGGPPVYVRGRAPAGPFEVALDRAAAFRLGVAVEDSVEVSGYRAVVSGLTTGTNILATQFIFADFNAIAAGTNSAGQASFVLVRLGRDADGKSVAATIEKRYPDLRAFPREYFIKSNEREVTAGFIPLMTLVMFLGAGAAALLVGLLLLAIVDERRSEIAVLMAMGTGSNAVGRGILARTTLISMEGALAGVFVSLLLEVALRLALPTIPLRIALADIVAVFLLFMGTGLAAAVGPVVRLNAIDPLEAFRS